jgi:hypothetical protein
VLLDLVSPWCAAVEATNSLQAQQSFRARHAQLLELLRRQRSPLSQGLPLETVLDALRPLARRAADPAGQQRLRDLLARATALGADGCTRIVLLAGDGIGFTAEPLPWPDGDVGLFLDRATDERSLAVALARSIAALTRWRAADSASTVRRLASATWDRWEAAREVPLREWIYTAGVGLHLAQLLIPETPPHDLLGVSRTGLSRLRQRERFLRTLLANDLEASGVGLVLRWLAPGTPAGPRTVAGTILPPMAGRYLAWRMVAERVTRVGVREAIRMAS